MIPHFYLHPGILNYTFGPQHPLKPERVQRTIALLKALYDVTIIEDTIADVQDVLRVHSPEYVNVVRELSRTPSDDATFETFESRHQYGFGSMDNPPFAGMFETSLDYVGSSAAAARAVRDGAPLAFGMGGGLHHAQREKASGFCIFNDCAIACSILRERFGRVAYVDIDVHHGEGVQWIFYDDANILTASIHEDGTTLYPGCGFVDETGVDFSALNVPVKAKTSGDVWLRAFEQGILTGIERWQPEAIVLQLGADTHYLDRLGHIRSTQNYWLTAVKHIAALGLPIVALGGGGYNMTTVPRMWTSAVLTLAGLPFDDQIPDHLAAEWGVKTFSDPEGSVELGQGSEFADTTIRRLRENHGIFAT